MFGLEAAKKLLAGDLYHYCPTGVNQFKGAGRWYSKPEPGDVIFFTNGTRAYHTGIVIEITSTRVKTIEGNTSGASGVKMVVVSVKSPMPCLMRRLWGMVDQIGVLF